MGHTGSGPCYRQWAIQAMGHTGKWAIQAVGHTGSGPCSRQWTIHAVGHAIGNGPYRQWDHTGNGPYRQ